MSSFVNLLDVVYPVGSIYMSVNATSPASIIGGTWKQVTDRFLYPTTSSLVIGGSVNHKHIMRWFNPDYYGWGNVCANSDGGLHPLAGLGYNNDSNNWEVRSFSKYGTGANYFNYMMSSNKCTVNNCDVYIQDGRTAGGGSLPPYITCYCWYRTA